MTTTPLVEKSQFNLSQISVTSMEANRKYLLENVSGYAKPKEMMAIMGSSGSGKTTLLNYLAQRF